ncbi:MAG: type VI secretion system protein ImpL [Proteobacteria bacterium]|nr:type VI secretion system protein ImpL [Pseudomonadota bacterium]
MIGKILKISLIVLLAILACLLIAGLVLTLDWPWWASLFIILGIFGIVMGVLFIRQKWLNYREKYFVEQIISQDKTPFEPGSKEKDKSTELKTRWTEAMHELKQSRLKEHGNPLYVLPWYMIMGESGSGKTTAIESAKLDSQFAQVNRVSGLSGTKNCDWWFFDEAIILDTAGRYAVPVDESRDKDEWQMFLSHLVKYRKKEPINGLIVTIPVDRLLQAKIETIEEYGKTIRQRIEELMLVLGASFPIHVMVTKCDLIKGMTEFSSYLPEKSLNQAMGLMNNDRSMDSPAFVDQVMSSIGDRLRDLRLILCQYSTSKSSRYGLNPSFLLFPEEFESIKTPLKAFVKGAFLENRYEEAAFLRGIFFSSGKQEGTPYSHFLKELGIIDKENTLQETSKGLFLHDYFAKILPNERELYAPTKRALELNKFTKNLWLSSYIAIAIAICGLLSFSFMKNIHSLNKISHEISDSSFLRGDLLSDVIILDRFRKAILDVNAQNRNWWIPRLGLNESRNVEDDLKREYCKRFTNAFLNSLFTKQISDRMTAFNRETPEEMVGDHIAHLVRRVNLLENAIRGDDIEALNNAPQPDCTVLFQGGNAIPEVLEKLNGLYLYYLYWGRNFSDLTQERAPLQTWLNHLVTKDDISLNWIVAWINKNPELKGLTLDDFWGGSRKNNAIESKIQASFTIKGKENKDAFLKELERALPDPLIVAGKKMTFESWYKKKYLDAWYQFGLSFPTGKDKLNGEEEWKKMASRMPTDQSPYFLFFKQMSTELTPVAEKDTSSWISMAREFNTIRSQGESLRAADQQQGLASLTSKGKSIVNKIKRIRKESGESTATIFNGYIDALSAIATNAPSQQLMYQLSEKTFNEDPVTSESPFWLAKNAVDVLRASMANLDASDKMVWKLITGPLDYLWQFGLIETGCQLQTLWNETVLVEIQGVSDQKMLNDLLLGKEGYANRFLSGPGKPFLNRDRNKGYQAKFVLDRSVKFKDAFLNFITKSDRAPKIIKDNYTVTIKGLPTDVNDKAKIKPHETLLELQCGDEIQELKNLNYPVRKNFNFSPNNCGDVSLKIKVGQLTLEKKYTGFPPFSKFLRDFSSGSVKFYPSDFPDKKANLDRMAIQYIVVTYQFTGNWPVINLLDVASGNTPEEIAACWDSLN